MSGFCNAPNDGADPALIAAWLAARSVARGLPLPIAVPDGWKVETGGETEWRRYVFARPSPEIARLARSIDRPGIYLKLCRDREELAAMLPEGWLLDPQSSVMIGPERPNDASLCSGYAAHLVRAGGAIHVRIIANNGELAASGFAAEASGVFVYDRIITERAHQRRGLGTVVMSLLDAERRDLNARSVLVATATGRALYERLGWSVHAPYASAVRRSPTP